MPQIVPIKELRDTNSISDKCHAVREPIFVTKNGYGDLVIMSMETYDEIMDSIGIDMAIEEAEREEAAGEELLDARETLQALRRRHFG